MIRAVFRVILAVLMCSAGVLHFVRPEPFIKIVPDDFTNAELLVSVSGFFEVILGAGLLWPITRRNASWGLISLYVAVFPANVNMALHTERYSAFPEWALWMRLPLQGVLIAWAWWVGRKESRTVS